MLKDALGSETVHRKTQVEPGKARARYFYLRHALVQAHDRSHDGKPEACASLAARTPFVDPIEAFEQMRQVLFRNTLAWIAYAEPDVLLLTVNLHHYSLPLWAVANGVGEQIREAAEFGKNRTLSRLGLSAFPVPLLPIRDLGSNGTKTQRRPAANVQLKYTSTGRQSAHWHRVRLGPLSALSDA